MRQLDTTEKELIHDPIKRRAWVKYQIHLQGRTMARLAADNGVDRRTLYQAFQKPYPRMEKIIAAALDLPPKELWPERYDADGLPNRMMGRPKKSPVLSRKDTTIRDAGNVNKKRAA